MLKPPLGEYNMGALAGAVVGSIGGLFAIGVVRAILGRNIALLLAMPILGLVSWLVCGDRRVAGGRPDRAPLEREVLLPTRGDARGRCGGGDPGAAGRRVGVVHESSLNGSRMIPARHIA